MFPTGSAGTALIVLRSVVAVTVLVHASTCWAMGSSLVVRVIAALVGLCLFLGFLTPYCAALSCVLELALLFTNDVHRLQLGMSALTAAATVALGPGAYSIDSRLFGRKLIKIPPGRNSP
jgi:hypothetical protein